MDTTTSPTQTTPTTIDSCHDLRWHALGFAFHGYCTIRYADNNIPGATFDVYCDDDGDEILIGRDLTDANATIRVNTANVLCHNGWSI